MWLAYSSCVATIQLPCGYHTGITVYHMGVVWQAHATIHSTNVQGISPIQLPYGYHTTLMLLPHSFCMTTLVWLPCNSCVVHISHMATIHSTHMQDVEGISMVLSYVDTIWDLDL